MDHSHIAILGNGITGVTAAREIRKRSDARITIISGETDHHFSRTALMYIFMGDLTAADTKPYENGFWDKNRIELRRGWVDEIDLSGNQLMFRDGGPIAYDSLILATGSQPNKFGWPGQDLVGVQGLYSMQDLEAMEALASSTRQAVIVGGGLIGVEVAEMLLTRGIGVTFLVRENHFWGSVLPSGDALLVGREIVRHGVDLRFDTELKEILSDADGRARAVVTKDDEEIPCQMVFLTAGVSPNIAMAKAAGIECGRGILVDERFRTSASDVWAGGDCAQHRDPPPGRRPVEQVWYTGKMHGEYIAANWCGDDRAYSPGMWFNSAKFFDIEYQTYGLVPSAVPESDEDFFWEHPDGDKSIRIRFDKASGAATGSNVFGIRQRHAVWETWITGKTPIGSVMADLGAANFDPEFYRQYEPRLVAAFNAQFPDRAIELRTKKGLFSSFFRNFQKPTPAAVATPNP